MSSAVRPLTWSLCQPFPIKRQATLEAIVKRLLELLDEKLEALLSRAEQEDDPFEQRLRAPVAVGKLDKLIAEATAEDEVGETIDLV